MKAQVPDPFLLFMKDLPSVQAYNITFKLPMMHYSRLAVETDERYG